MARRALVAAVVAGLALTGCGGDDSSDDASTPSASKPLLGVTSGAVVDASLDSELRVMEKTGVTALRAPFYWPALQPQPGPPSFAASDHLVAAAARAHIELLPTVLLAPGWAARHPGKPNSPPKGTAAFADLMRALVERYGPDGDFWTERPKLPKVPIRAWQIWNEPDHLHYWSDQPYQEDYVALGRAAREAIKGADPDALVVMAGFADRSWKSIASVYGAGGKGVFDVVAVHPYTFEVRNVLRIVRLVREALVKAGDPDRPLWLTEVTWSSGKRPGVKPFPFETTEADQAAKLGEALPLLIDERDELGIDRIFWENWISKDTNHGNPFDFSGLRVLRPDGSVREKPAYAVFKRIALAQRGEE